LSQVPLRMPRKAADRWEDGVEGNRDLIDYKVRKGNVLVSV